MRDALAERLLATVLDWSPSQIAAERPTLQALARFKYDEYQQFSAGMRYIESLAMWLGQMETVEERRLAFDLIRSKLVFVSNAEMHQLVATAFPDFIRPLIITQVAEEIGCRPTLVARVAASLEYRVALRRTLFLGLSDGAHSGLFRRYNPSVSHEQVLASYEISSAKSTDLRKTLATHLQAIVGRPCDPAHVSFRNLVLLDDFSASGLSYARVENGHHSGKIMRILDSIIAAENSPFYELVDQERTNVWIILYLATEHSIDHLRKLTQAWTVRHATGPRVSVAAIHTLPSTMRVTPETYPKIAPLLEKYFDSRIIDEHYRKGKHTRPYLGFDEGALPLVLTHNSPNNSLALIWLEETCRYRGLFPRVSRHRRAD